MPASWIVIEEWDRFQHYKDRVPIWVKTYVELLHDDNYLSLSGNRRAILHGLWLEFAMSRRQVLNNTRVISRRLALKVSRRDLEALNHAGFITFSASKPLAPRYQDASPDKEKEKKPPNPLSDKPTKPRGDKTHPCEICGLELPTDSRLAEHLENVHASITNGTVIEHVTVPFDQLLDIAPDPEDDLEF